MNTGDSDAYCVLQISGYLTGVQETPSLVVCVVVQTSHSLAERAPTARFPQLLPAACCTLLRVTFWTPKNQVDSGVVCRGEGILLWCPLLSDSASPSVRNKVTKCLEYQTQNTGEVQGTLKRKTI